MTSPQTVEAKRKVVAVYQEGHTVARVGSDGVTEIREIDLPGHMSMMPAWQAWCGDELFKEANQFGYELEFETPERDKVEDERRMPF